MFGLKQFEKFDYVPFIFCDRETDDTDYPFISLIIGNNATGKSRLLRILTEIFNDLYKFKTEGNTNFSFKGGYKIEYNINGETFLVANNRENLRVQKNNSYCSIDDLMLPDKLVASSYSINDRFPHQPNNYSTLNRRTATPKSRYDNSFYEYLGIRTFNNMASASGHITRTIDILFNASLNNKIDARLIEVFNVLDFRPQLSIEYKFKNYGSILGKRNLSKEYLIDFISNLDEKKAGFSYKHFQELLFNEQLLDEIVDYVQVLQRRKESKFPVFFDLDFENISSFVHFSSEHKILSLLRKLNLVGYGEITVYKNDGSRFDINKGSSGEINLFTSFLSLACTIEDNSIILIDEPEISLHPNWQMRYLDLLNSIFHSRYSNTHFIICTHSHFLVSDLRPESSHIIALRNVNGNLEAINLEKTTFGWSAEQILLEVFNVPTTRNYFVAEKIGEILELIAHKDRDEILIKQKVTELIDQNILALDASDPLENVWSKLVAKYG